VTALRRRGKPVKGFGIELHGDHDTIMRASKAAREFVQWASEQQRVECPLADLWVVDEVRRIGHDVGMRRESDGG
jgi:(2R)-sulfolactate sulfo-lyase subunit beta